MTLRQRRQAVAREGGGSVTRSEHELAEAIATPGVQAVLVPPPALPDQLAELAPAVESGAFRVPRAELDGIGIGTVATWLDRNLPRRAVSTACRDALLSEILHLVHLAEAASGVTTFRLRIFTEAPSRRCGFHVDTVPPGLPTWGVLRVFNGRGTNWVEPRAVRSIVAFYDWLQHRDRVVREHTGDPVAGDARLETLDRRPDFLVEGATVERVPTGTNVVFRHLDARHHWSDHAPELAWIHASPMTGRPRLVVNVSPARSPVR